MNYKVNKFITETVSQLLFIIFGFLTFYHIKNFESFEIKLGMSDFFTPAIVGYISKIVISLNLIACISFLLFKRKWTYFFSAFIFLLYSVYNITLYFKPGSDCGCANILFSNMSILLQLILFSSLSIISSLSTLLFKKTNNTQQFS